MKPVISIINLKNLFLGYRLWYIKPGNLTHISNKMC